MLGPYFDGESPHISLCPRVDIAGIPWIADIWVTAGFTWAWTTITRARFRGGSCLIETSEPIMTSGASNH